MHTLSLGPLVLVGTQRGLLVDVTINTDLCESAGEATITAPEWQSLVALVDVLHAADRRHAQDRSDVERFRNSMYALETRIGALKTETAAMTEERDMWRSIVAQPDERHERTRIQNETLARENARITNVSVDYAIEAGQLRAEVDVLKQEVRELEQQRDAARTDMEAAEQRMLGVLDGTFATGDGTAQREIERLRAENEKLRAECHGRRFDPNLVRELDQLQPLVSVLGDWDWDAIHTNGWDRDGFAIMAAVRALAHVAREKAKVTQPHVDDESRCAVCGWPLAETIEQGCARGNCSYRPRPEKLYASERAEREALALRERMKGGQ